MQDSLPPQTNLPLIKAWSSCRLCGSARVDPLFTVHAPKLARFPATRSEPVPEAPLAVMRCADCTFVQLTHSVNPLALYDEYWYESGVNERMVQELQDVVQDARARVELLKGDHVLDIGANDGTLLAQYETPRVYRVAVEPSPTFADRLGQIADLTVENAFPLATRAIPPIQFKIITSIACFYDTDDPAGWCDAIRRLLHPYGVWICQFQDLEQQVRANAWDNVVHEHVGYYTLGTFRRACWHAGLDVVDVVQTPINGGSLRVCVKHQHGALTTNAALLQQATREDPLVGPWWREAHARMVRSQEQTATLVSLAASRGPVDMIGASTKSNTLVQAAGIAPLIRSVWERNPRKFGRFTSTGIPIVDERAARTEDLPAALLLSIWQFRDAIMQRERETLRQVPLIIPLPETTLVAAGDYA